MSTKTLVRAGPWFLPLFVQSSNSDPSLCQVKPVAANSLLNLVWKLSKHFEHSCLEMTLKPSSCVQRSPDVGVEKERLSQRRRCAGTPHRCFNLAAVVMRRTLRQPWDIFGTIFGQLWENFGTPHTGLFCHA